MKATQAPAKRIVIAGGGFAGVTVAHALRSAVRAGRVEVILVSRENAFVFYPLMPEVISGALGVETILTSIHHAIPHAQLAVGEVTSLELEHREVKVLHGLYQHRQRELTLSYDYLVLALGGIPASFGIPGLDEYTFDVQRLSNAFALRNHLIDLLEQAAIETDPEEQERLLTVVVIGGGQLGSRSLQKFGASSLTRLPTTQPFTRICHAWFSSRLCLAFSAVSPR